MAALASGAPRHNRSEGNARFDRKVFSAKFIDFSWFLDNAAKLSLMCRVEVSKNLDADQFELYTMAAA